MTASQLTQIDMAALEAMPESEWFSWADECLKGVNRPHFRCIRLRKAGYLAFRITNPDAPYQSVEFMKINRQEGDDDSHATAT